MSQERKETATPLTYEEELKALKEKWAGKRKEERKEKQANKKAEEREATVYLCKQAIEILKDINPAFKKELAPVVTRLNMFVNGERFTRNFNKGDNE